jgi:RNA polymerase sigma-70 factor (ECF subfamily)
MSFCPFRYWQQINPELDKLNQTAGYGHYTVYGSRLDGRKLYGSKINNTREPLIFCISRYTGDIETAEDLAEDVFVELIIHPGRYGFRSSFKTYIFAIGRNKAVDYIRKRSRLSLVSEENLEETADLRTLEEHVIKGEANLQLSRALNQINEDYRTALHLVYLEDMSYDEAGRIMKKTRKQVENLVYRGKKAVRAVLEKENY